MGPHGGTLRLRASLDAAATLGESELFVFEAGTWRPADPASVGDGLPVAARPAGLDGSLKRRAFPSTLWESRRAALASGGELLRALGDLSGATVVVHTSYLAALASALRARGARVVIDVYDLVWRSHENDGLDAAAALRLLRRAYARTVRFQELRGLRNADALVVAGHADRDVLPADAPESTWIPTPPMQREPVPAPTRGERLSIGFLGHFHHQHTYLSARALLSAPIAHDSGVSVVLAGIGSAGYRVPDGVTIMGDIHDPNEFYSRVDSVVVPVVGGSGMKVKLAEAMLAGRPAFTTPRGLEGFPPQLRRHFLVGDIDALNRAAIHDHIEGFDQEAARREFGEIAGWDPVVTSYARVLADRESTDPASIAKRS